MLRLLVLVLVMKDSLRTGGGNSIVHEYPSRQVSHCLGKFDVTVVGVGGEGVLRRHQSCELIIRTGEIAFQSMIQIMKIVTSQLVIQISDSGERFELLVQISDSVIDPISDSKIQVSISDANQWVKL